MLLDGKVAIVTGSATGIGEGIARLFSAEGARVVLLDRDGDRNEEVARSLPGICRAVQCDVTRRDELQHAVRVAVEEFNGVDILINNAGIYPRQPFLNMTEAQWDELHSINSKSMFHTCQLVVPLMISRGHGKIVNISSVTFHIGMANLTHYVASKGAIIGFTRSLAREFGGHGIHVNCVTPGAVLVESERRVATPEKIREIEALQSIKRRIVPLDIARVCLFLSTELSDAITGQTINVDGGWAMH